VHSLTYYLVGKCEGELGEKEKTRLERHISAVKGMISRLSPGLWKLRSQASEVVYCPRSEESNGKIPTIPTTLFPAR
jgi:hypothetical protein